MTATDRSHKTRRMRQPRTQDRPDALRWPDLTSKKRRRAPFLNLLKSFYILLGPPQPLETLGSEDVTGDKKGANRGQKGSEPGTKRERNLCTVQVGIKPSQIIQPQAPLALSGCSFRPFPGLSLVLEIHIAHILDARGIEYEAQAKTENGKKPDFLFPSQAAYEDPAFPEEQLRMLASKTSIKDRFRQVADEANRIRDKHLFTLTPGDVTHPKLAQLDELHIHLVMPKVVKESYDDLIQGETMTFSRFIEEIQGLQADRPQSLTLL